MAYLQFLPLRVFVKVVSLDKHHKEKFEKDKAWHAQEQLQLVHSDICGPLETPSLSSALYFITFIDDYSRKTWVYFLKHKSEAFVVFQEFKALVEKESRKCIKTLHTDNVGEYTKNEFSTYLSKHGIKHQRTVPYTPQ
jgi:transposase InsO family protein